MGFVREHVPKEDWDLYNSFELINTSINIGQKKYANENSYWTVDRERKIYFIMTGGLGREGIDYYTLIWKGKKINVDVQFERRFSDKMKRGYRVSEIVVDEELMGNEKEILEILNEVLQIGWKNSPDFIEFSKPIYREGIK